MHTHNKQTFSFGFEGMGDSGALFSGFALAGLSVAGVLKSLTATMVLPILILVVPILDISFSVFRRLLKGSNPMKADAEHIHHKLLQAGFSHNRTAAILYLVCAGAGSVAAILVGAQRVYLTILLIVLSLMLLLSRLANSRKVKESDKLADLNELPQEEFQV